MGIFHVSVVVAVPVVLLVGLGVAVPAGVPVVLLEGLGVAVPAGVPVVLLAELGVETVPVSPLPPVPIVMAIFCPAPQWPDTSQP